jgi:UDP-N-acetylglucosamine 2-epimerase (non-hydrolysing)
LRSFDKGNPYPEEVNRRMVSLMADIHLCPTQTSANNVFHDLFSMENVHVVGNTVIDNLLPYKDKCEYTNKILVTLHRRENHHWMDRWFIAVDQLAGIYPQYEFILPIHPNPDVQKHRHLLKNVKVVNPLPYDQMLDLLVKTRIVITDSGGLQEECSFFNKKCLTCRVVTERPEAVGQSTFLVKSPDDLADAFMKHIDDHVIDHECPFGDGHSAEKIYNILKESV